MDTPNFDVAPFTIIYDSREQAPFTFKNLKSTRSKGDLVVHTKKVALTAGDYSIEGMESQIAIERKSIVDFFSCCGHDRERFQKQIIKLAYLEWAAVVVEASLSTCLSGIPQSDLNPWTIYYSMLAWQQRFPSVHWWLCPGRTMAEMTTFRLLERWWRDTEEGKRDDARKRIDGIIK